MKSNSISTKNKPFTVFALGMSAVLVACGAAEDTELADWEQASDAAELDTTEQALTTSNGPHATWRVTSQFLSRQTLLDTLSWLDNNQREIDAMATAPNGSWVLVSGGARWYSGSFPVAARTAIGNFLSAGQRIVAIDFNANGGWVVVTETTQAYGGSVPQSLKNKIAEYRQKNWGIEDVDITNDSYVVIGSGNLASWTSALDNTLEQVLSDRLASKRKLRQVDIGFDGRFAVVADQASATEGVSTQFADRLRAMAEDERSISRFMFGLDDNYVIYSHGRPVPNASAIEAIEYGVGSQNIWQAMRDANIPGLSIAIVDNNKVVNARAYGRLRADEQGPVVASTPFDLASLSKFIGALTILRLRDRGEVNVTDDILSNPGSLINSWENIGENANSAALYGMPGTALPAGITLTRLMQHRAGMTPQGGSPGAHPDNWNLFANNSRALPNLLGYTCGNASGCSYPGNKWVWASGTPGGNSNYDSVNYALVQAVAEDASGERAVELLEDLLLNPMGLDNISARVPLDTNFEARTAWQHDTAGTPRSIRALYPHIFAGGVNASAANYAEMLILALNQGVDSKGTRRISTASINLMLNGQDRNAGFGMFFEGGNDALEGSDRSFVHSGSHGNRARTRMCGNPTRNQGIVILANVGKNAAVDAVFNGILDTFTSAMGWPGNLNCR